MARYREELHNFEDRHEAMAAAMRSAGPAVLASAATVIAALLCLTVAKVNGTAGLGPIGAIGVACAAISMLTLLPALLTIYGRRAFWPFVPHTPNWAGAHEGPQGGLGQRIVNGSRVGALLPVIAACLLFPFYLLGWIVKTLIFLVTFGKVRIRTLVKAPVERAVFKPYELRRFRHEHAADATHGFWARVGDRVARTPRGCSWVHRRAARDVRRPGLLLHRPHHQRQLPHRGRVRRRARTSWPRASRPARACPPT